MEYCPMRRQAGDETLPGSPWYVEDEWLAEREDAALAKRLCGDELHDVLSGVALLCGADADDWLDDARRLAEEGAVRLDGMALWRLLWCGDADSMRRARDELVERMRKIWSKDIEAEIDAEDRRLADEGLADRMEE